VQTRVSSGNPGMRQPLVRAHHKFMGRLSQLIRDLSSVKCSQTEALRRLLKSGPIDSVPRKLGNREDGLLRKMASGTFLAIRGAVTEVIVFSKIVISRKRA
jgi:hypothetical protein